MVGRAEGEVVPKGPFKIAFKYYQTESGDKG